LSLCVSDVGPYVNMVKVNMYMWEKGKCTWEKGKCIRREMSTGTGDDPGPYRSVHALYVYPMCGPYVNMNIWEKGK
jgi:hypothetical protein